MPGRIGAELGELGFQVVHLAHDQPRVHEQFLPGRCQFDTPAVAVQQARVELRLQGLDARTCSCRREECAPRALGQAR
ncbi:hypothetical protein D3C72_2254520 [compost metagenome]